MTLELKSGEAANLLSLDGGGIKGISSLVILKAIMDKVQEIEDGNTKRQTPSRKPVDYFHLAGGTSTGGIIALMLFRLRMTPDQATDAYNAMAKTIFGTKLSGEAATYSDGPLRKAIDQIMIQYAPVEDKAGKGDTKLVNNKGRMFMCATLQERGESILLRSYTPPRDAVPVSEHGKTLFDSGFVQTMSVSEAARATSAAPTYFPEVRVPVQGRSDVVFWDGGLLNNNPIDQVWRARLDLVKENEPAPKVACVLSIGTSWSSVDAPSMIDSWIPKPTKGGLLGTIQSVANSIGNWTKDQIYSHLPVLKPVEKMIPFLTNTEAKHLDFSRYMRRLEGRATEIDGKTKYFRFNTPTDTEYIDMAESAKMPRLTAITQEWLASPDSSDYVESCARLLAKKASSK